MIRDRIDFIGIGAPKCGTTWISACLAQHPEIGFANDKEVYYFADSLVRSYFHASFNHYARGPQWYHLQFPSSKPAARIFGEYTVDYMYDPRSAERIFDYHPDIRILVALRNPVDMVYSWYWYNRVGLIANLPDTFEAAMAIPAFRDLGCYDRALKPFFDRFPPDRIKILLYDDIRANPQDVLRDLFLFFGVDPTFQPSQMENRVNPAMTTRFPFLQRLGQATYAALNRMPLVSSIVNSRSFERSLLAVYGRINRMPKAYASIQPGIRKELTRYYKDDLKQLEGRMGRGLNEWYDER